MDTNKYFSKTEHVQLVATQTLFCISFHLIMYSEENEFEFSRHVKMMVITGKNNKRSCPQQPFGNESRKFTRIEHNDTTEINIGTPHIRLARPTTDFENDSLAIFCFQLVNTWKSIK